MIRNFVLCVGLFVCIVQGQEIQENEVKSPDDFFQELTNKIPQIIRKYHDYEKIIDKLKIRQRQIVAEEKTNALREIASIHGNSDGEENESCRNNATQAIMKAHSIVEGKILKECFGEYLRISSQIVELLEKGLANPAELVTLLKIPSNLSPETTLKFVKFVIENHSDMSHAQQAECINVSKAAFSEALHNAVDLFEECRDRAKSH